MNPSALFCCLVEVVKWRLRKTIPLISYVLTELSWSHAVTSVARAFSVKTLLIGYICPLVFTTRAWKQRRALSIQRKIPKILKRGQMVRKFPGKVSRKSGNCWISEKWTILLKVPEIPGGKSNGMEISENLGIPHEIVLYHSLGRITLMPNMVLTTWKTFDWLTDMYVIIVLQKLVTYVIESMTHVLLTSLAQRFLVPVCFGRRRYPALQFTKIMGYMPFLNEIRIVIWTEIILLLDYLISDH